MLNIDFYKEDSISFYKDIVVAKRNTTKKPRLKQELDAIYDSQYNCFESYDVAFNESKLESCEPQEYALTDKVNLQSLYSYRNKKIRELKILLTSHPLDKERILNTCQNCTINEVDTMDHVLGQTAFPEYSVHPRNLFPCCTVCNKKKSDQYLNKDGAQIFLNLYLDNLPLSQYLFVEFDEKWMPRFKLSKPEDVSGEMFDLIKSHYLKLDLLKRFRDASNEIISSFSSTIRFFGSDDISNKTNELCQELAPVLGYNHRQVVLVRALGNSEEFIRECLR